MLRRGWGWRGRGGKTDTVSDGAGGGYIGPVGHFV